MKYLTTEQILFIHARLISETGGEHGVLDLGLLQSAVARPQATFDGQNLYPDLFSKAAAMLESLIGNHAFVDGNKRTAITAAGLFLRLNGHRLTASNQQLETYTLHCAQRLTPMDQMALWLENHSEKTPLQNNTSPTGETS
jgi:death-on-curing protein